jgi:toxin YoeB
MERYTLRLSRECDIHLQHWQKVGNKALLRKIEKIFSELIEHPTTGTGKPELLKGDHSGYWSRRINKKRSIIPTAHTFPATDFRPTAHIPQSYHP